MFYQIFQKKYSKIIIFEKYLSLKGIHFFYNLYIYTHKLYNVMILVE